MIRKHLILGLVLFPLIFAKSVFAINEEEIRFGNFQDKFLSSTYTMVFNEALNRRINEIGHRISKASDKSQNIKYTFKVINDPIINAYAAAGGFIYVTTGLLDILDSEDELAATLAHEIAHVNESHQIRRVYAKHRAEVALHTTSIVLTVAAAGAGGVAGVAVAGATASATSSLSTQMVTSVATYAARSAAETAVQMLGKAAAGAIIASTLEGYGKSRELEADALAVKYAKNAGYDPNGLIGVLRKCIAIRDQLKLNEKNYASSLINAEPGLDERVKNAEELILRAK